MFDKPANIFRQQIRDDALDKLTQAYPQKYSGDNMFVANRNMRFLDDQRFAECMERHALAEPYKGMAWRMHVLIWCVKTALKHPGAIMEFGTFRGFKFKFLLDYFGAALDERKIFLFDTFEGIDPKQADGSPIAPSEHAKAHLYDFVVERFRPHTNVEIVRGAAPGSLDGITHDPPCFVHLDMNSWMAEIGVLERLWPIMPGGSVIVLDDFGLFSHRAQAEHEEPWFDERGASVLELPTGQGLVIKHV